MNNLLRKPNTIFSWMVMICLSVFLTGCKDTIDMEQKVNELYSKMSQEERIAQLRSMYMDELFDEQGIDKHAERILSN